MLDISELLGTKYPIIQGAMGVISNPEMVSAVSEAGGFGLLATAFLTDSDKLKTQIEGVKKLTDKPFGANLVALNPKSLEFAEILADAGIKAVTTSAGSPKPSWASSRRGVSRYSTLWQTLPMPSRRRP